MKWTVHLEGGPRRVNHAAVALNEGEKIFSFGGYSSVENYDIRRPMDIHMLDTYTYRWMALPVPTSIFDEQYSKTPYQRYGHTVVPYRNTAFLWGGRNDSDGGCDALFQFRPDNCHWSVITCRGQTPPKRDGHSACVHENHMIIFGGYEEDFQRFSNETYQLDFRNMQWQRLNTTGLHPAHRDFHTSTVIGNRMYVFGGRSDLSGQFLTNREFYDNELRYLDLNDNHWHLAHSDLSGVQSPSSPPNWPVEPIPARPQGRRSQSAWEYKGNLYVFGGYNGRTRQHFNDLYRFNTNLLKWEHMIPHGDGPKPRRRQCCVPVGDRVFLFGGTSPINDTVILDDDDSFEKNLVDHSDLYVLDTNPSLKTLCLTTITENNLHKLPEAEQFFDALPAELKMDLAAMTTPNKVNVNRVNNNG